MTTRRALATALVVLVALTGCSNSGQSRPGSSEPEQSRTPSPSPTTSPSGTPSGSAAPGRCRGVTTRQVKGPLPAYGPTRLRTYAVSRAVCSAYWIGRTARDFVPQSLAIDGSTAYVGGYLKRPAFTDQACQIVVLDLRTGRETRFQARFEASVYRPAPTFCRHGGGMQLNADGLWVQETERLWLLDPDRIGRGDPVVRVWRMRKGIRGSTVVVDGQRLGVAGFRTRGPGRIVWYRIADLLRPGVSELVPGDGDATQADPVQFQRTVPLVQGITAAGGLWYSVSGGRCYALVGPDGVRHGWVPGAEGLQFVGPDVWVLSESGARHIVCGRDTTVPPLQRLRTAKVLGAKPAC